MIELINVRKTFYNKAIFENISLNIPNATIFGLAGANGSGKSTLLRLMSGIYHADGGFIKIDGQAVYENVVVKQQIRLVSEAPYFFGQATMAEMRKFYQVHYPEFDDRIYRRMIDIFQLNEKKRLHRFSLGIKKQAALALALSCNSKYLLLDETLSSLDTIVRHTLLTILKKNLEETGQTIVVASDNLSELQENCDSLGLIKDGQIIISGSQAELASDILKLQLSFKKDLGLNDFDDIEVLDFKRCGHVITLLVRGDINKTKKRLKNKDPLYIDVLPATLKDTLIYEMETRDNEKEK